MSSRNRSGNARFALIAYIASLKRELRECIPIDGTLIGRKPFSGRKYLFIIKVIDDCLSVALRRYEKILDTIEVGACPRFGCGIIQPRGGKLQQHSPSVCRFDVNRLECRFSDEPCAFHRIDGQGSNEAVKILRRVVQGVQISS